ncbi:hypothetical protein [Chitinilyticum aquatile]|uniref:hypothetical protein n=1 Tax=Chitinilyticum aquatile TaxID=362520 RepID=UPI000428A87F|nr:hypothetical protein [Chitinilyticum aquatile]
MQKQIHELFEILADGGLDAADLDALTAEVGKAAADADAYLAADSASGYPAFAASNGDAAMPLWQWVLLEQLEGGMVFRGNRIAELYDDILDAFGEGELDLAAETLAGHNEDAALKLVLEELAPAYTLVNFAQPIDARRQMVLVRSTKLESFLAVCRELNLPISPAL